MMLDITAFIDGLSAFFAEGTALGALVTFLVANLPSLAVTISTLKRWIGGAKMGMQAVQADCKKLAQLYEQDVARLQSTVDAQRVTLQQVLAVLALAFGNSKLDPAVRAEIEKLITGAINVPDEASLSALLAKTSGTAQTEQGTLPPELTAFAGEPVILQG